MRPIKNSRAGRTVAAIVSLISLLLCGVVTAAEALPGGATVLDDATVMYSRPDAVISPNGQLIAYVSRGWVCVADIKEGTTRRLMEVPDTWTHVFARFPEARHGGDVNSLSRLVPGKELAAQVKAEIVGLQWAADSNAVVFSVHSYDAANKNIRARIWRAPLADSPTMIASNERSISTRRGPGGTITRDGRFLVGNFGRDRALIWDLATNKPRATPFLHLTPSPTSGRWLGVEKDTRQLVLLNEDFTVVHRYEEILPECRFGFDLAWSSDERFAFWRQQIGFDHYSNWVGCRYDLETGGRQIFTGDYMSERIAFTGRRGEFLRVGAAGIQPPYSGLTLNEQYIAIVPDGENYAQHVWHQHADWSKAEEGRKFGRMSCVTWSPKFDLFTIGLPRQEGPYGDIMHLVDRERHLWRMPGVDSGGYLAPYHVVGFAQGGDTIVAYDETRLLAIPVSAVQTPANQVH